MADNLKPNIRPFSNKGLQLKEDPALIRPDQYQELTNMVSEQEGNLTVRNGNRRISNEIGTSGYLDTVTKLRVSEETLDDQYYVCENGNIWRAAGPLPNPGSTLTFAQIATSASAGAAYTQRRIASCDYIAGSVGTSWKLFAGNQKLLKDNGSLPQAQTWGIIPPSNPVTAFIDYAEFLPGYDMVGATGSFTRIPGPATVVGITTFAPPPGSVTIIPSSMQGIYRGMIVKIGSQYGLVNGTQESTFQVYLTNLPSVGDQIVSGILTETAPHNIPTFGVIMDASLGGAESEGYATTDPVHIAISLSDPTQFTDIRLRVLVNGSTTDYYEKSILPNALQPQFSLQQTPLSTLQTASTQIAQGVIGGFDISDPTVNVGKPVQLNPSSPGADLNSMWTEINIPKTEFASVGNAGQGPYTWQNVTGFQVVYTVVDGTTPSISVSSIYISGGQGPNAYSTSQTTPLYPYRYVYTYRNPLTGAESNPSQEMIQANWITPARQRVQIQCWASIDPQITGPGSIAIYRAGGSFADSLYRFVGYFQNPSVGTNGYFYDNQSDQTIASNDIAEFDNDAPVTSTLTVPCTLSFNGWSASGNHGVAGELSGVSVNVVTGPTNNIGDYLRPGSVVHISQNSLKAEDAYIYSVGFDGPNTLIVFFQYDHRDWTNDGTIVMEIDAVAGQPCDLTLAAFDCVFLAGDPNNPHVLYKSKTGRPEAFPVIDLGTQTSNQINVGSPSNPIINFCEFAGTVLCMNYRNLYVVGISSGIMGTPQDTPCQRGLVTKNGWCIADNELWFLGYDGIYSWSGGQAVWRTEALDPLFRGVAVGNYQPINMTAGLGTVGLDVVEMAYVNNEIFMTYTDAAGTFMRLRYHTKFDRWSIEKIFDPGNGDTPVQITAIYEDQDFGNLLLAKNLPAGGFLYLDDYGASDGCFTNDNDGHYIEFEATPGSYIAGATSMDALFSDLILESTNTNAAVNIVGTYNFTAPFDSWTIPAAPGVFRGRYPFQVRAGLGYQAHAMTIQFSGTTTYPVTIYSFGLNIIPLAQYSKGRAFDWDDLGWPGDKVFRALTIEVDTGGVQGLIQPYGDGVAMGPALPITTSQTDRRRILTMTSGPGVGQNDLIAKNVRPVLIPGVGGKMDYFNHQWEFVREPLAVTHLDSFEQSFEIDAFKFIKQVWQQYSCASTVTLSIYVDNGYLFWTQTMPSFLKRDVFRFYLPAYIFSAQGTILNKSKRYRFVWDSASPLKLYRDASKVEYMICGADQRSSYKQMPLSSMMPLDIGGGS